MVASAVACKIADTPSHSGSMKLKPSNILNGLFLGVYNNKLGLTISLTSCSASVDESIPSQSELNCHGRDSEDSCELPQIKCYIPVKAPLTLVCMENTALGGVSRQIVYFPPFEHSELVGK